MTRPEETACRLTAFVIMTVLTVMTAASVTSCRKEDPDGHGYFSGSAEMLERLNEMSSIADYQGIIDYANSMLQDPDCRSYGPAKLLCLASAAQCYIKTDWAEKAKEYLDSASALVAGMPQAMRQDTLFMEGFYTYCNTMMMHYVYDDIDYREAISYAAAALDSAQRRGNSRQNIIFGINYAILNTQIQESYAYEGAEELLRLALETGDRRQISQTAQVCAWRHTLLGNEDKARQYMETAIEYLPEGYMDASTIYADYALALAGSGFRDKAGYYFEKALGVSDPKVSSSALSVYLSYAEFLASTGKPRKAEQMYRRGMHLADSAGTRWNKKSFCSGLYSLLKEQGRYPEALEVMDSYISEADSIAAERQRKDLIELRIKYETAVKENIIKENEKKIAQQNERLSIIAAAVIVFVSISVLLTILYFHKRASYRALFRLYSEILSEKSDRGPLRPQGDNPEKYETIFSNIEKAMREGHIYRESGLTIEKAAASTNTNRTYLSAAIKQNTGLSFIYYVNSYRIREAIRILSDPDDDTPMKAVIMNVGFKSPTTFYKLFSEATGKTPLTWRNECRRPENTFHNPQL